MPQPYKLFTIYAREDAQYLEELRGQLRPLEHAGRIKVWSDREINPGVDWEQEIVHNLDSADIILILVSAAYYNSAYIHEKEITHAIGRHERGEAKVLPVIVRPCSFPDDPVISRLQVLPTDGKPVTSHHWRQRDEAWLDVVAGVKKTLNLFDAAVSDKARAKEQAQQATRTAEAVKAKEDASRLLREQEQIAWQQTTAAHLVLAYENYLARYPQGEYAREARARIKTLKKAEKSPFPLRRWRCCWRCGWRRRCWAEIVRGVLQVTPSLRRANPASKWCRLRAAPLPWAAPKMKQTDQTTNVNTKSASAHSASENTRSRRPTGATSWAATLPTTKTATTAR